MNKIENHKLRWGIHKGKMLKEIPNNYLEFILKTYPDIFKGKILVYIKNKLNYPKDKYQVTVTDSVGTDGNYIVEAYSPKQAMDICKSKYNIQITQSHHGTGFSTIKL